jgi:hypothetical protein
MEYLFWPILIPIVAIVGAFTYSIVRAIANARVRELEVRERIAMIERGLVPPPEKDPTGFDRAMSRYDRYRSDDDGMLLGRRSPGRYRTAGVTLIGVGLGLMILIGVAGENMSSAIGVGGFLVVIGLAFVVNSLIGERYESRLPSRDRVASPPTSPQEPPHSV